jgi:two-component system sensor histidine kinase UhpB
MSLRFRLIAAISAMLLAALAIGAAAVCWSAHASVQTEMRGAMAGAEMQARVALARRTGEVTPAFIPELVMRFNGQRHVRAVALEPGGRVWLRSQPMKSDERPPGWFRSLIGVRPQSLRLMLSPPTAPAGSMLLLQTDSTNEISEVWRQARDAVGVMLLFSAGVYVATFLIIGHTLRRFAAFDRALSEIADGRYDAALAERGSPEFIAMARGFNRMAHRLRQFQQSNRDLNKQILTLQEEERAEIARDLHDEVGPYLFAINVDAGDIPRLLHENDRREVTERAASIRDAASHIQKHVKAILRQLRPTSALEFGLPAAIDDLIGFWTRRCPDIALTAEIVVDGAKIERRIEDTAYRLVQESLSNAVRHGGPSRIAVSIVASDRTLLSISVTDDGAGLPAGSPRAGMGLVGMAERVRALNGRFEITGVDGGRGVRVSAHLPLRRHAAHELAPTA